MSRTCAIGIKDNKNVAFFDPMKVIETRLLITSTSGGGKSWTQRTVVEITDGIYPRIILDPEGEFSSLREKFPFVLAGKGKDVPADLRTAATLARKALELDLNLIVDLYELPHVEKHEFVRIFLEALLDAPKNLWRPRLVMIDEAHKFIPENGEGSSSAKAAGIRLLDSGRKRGLGTVLATQRLAKLSKDAAAECWNKMVGPTAWDDDRIRAAKELGIPLKDKDIFRTLKPGEFIVAGPALCQEPTRVTMRLPETNHPKAGIRSKAKAPAPTAKVKAVLAKLADLPKEAAAQLKTEEDLRAEISRLTKELREAKKPSLGYPVDLSEKELARVRKEAQAQVDKLTNEFDRRRAAEIRKAVGEMRDGIHKLMENVVKVHAAPTEAPEISKSSLQLAKPGAPKPWVDPAPRVAKTAPAALEGNVKFGACERAIAGFLAINPTRYWTRAQIAIGSGYSLTSSGFKNSLSKLRVSSILHEDGEDRISINMDQALKVMGTLQVAQNARGAWEANLGKCELAFLRTLEQNRNRAFSLEDLCAATPPYSAGSSGVKNAISRLNVLQVITKHNGMIAINPEMLEV